MSMSETEYAEMLKDALLANSYDYDSMKLAIKKTFENSFSYLYVLQQAYVSYEEIHYTSNEGTHRKLETVDETGYLVIEDNTYYLPNMTGGFQHYTELGEELENDIVTPGQIIKFLKDEVVEEKTYTVDKYIIQPNASGNLFLNKKGKACFNCDFNFIDYCNRKEYRLSDFYLREFTFDDMVANPTIFNKIPIIFIDDRVLLDFSMRIMNEANTIFVLPFEKASKVVYSGERDPDDNRLLYADHTIKVLVIDNIYCEKVNDVSGVQIKKTNLYPNATNKSVRIYKSWFPNMSSAKLSKHTGELFCTIGFPDSTGYTPQLETSIIHLEDSGSTYYTAYLSDGDFTTLAAYNSYLSISLIFFNRLHRHTFYTGNTYTMANSDGESELMVIQEDEKVPYNTPIPIEDFMILKNSSGERTEILNHFEDINLYYPNVYKINDSDAVEGDKYTVFYFYYPIEGFQYELVQAFFYAYLKIEFGSDVPLEQIVNQLYFNTVDGYEFSKEYLAYMMEYEYHKHKYGEIDYINRYLDADPDKIPWNYFEESLKEWIHVQPFVLRDYVIQQKCMNKYYHMYTNSIYLEGRRRTDTSTEMPDIGVTTFNEDMYVFALSNTQAFPNSLQIRVFVDGIMIQDVEQITYKFLDYIYIPTHYVTDDSYIEIEIFPHYGFENTVTFSEVGEEQTIMLTDLNGPIKPTLADLYFEDVESGNRYDNSLFDISIEFKEGTYKAETTDEDKPVVFTLLTVIKITPLSENILDTEIKVCVNKIPNGVNFTTVADGYPYIVLSENWFNYSVDYIRVFKDGRLLPRCRYIMFTSYKYPVLVILTECKEGEYIYVDITPYRYKEIYYQEELSPDTTLIDLRGYITKPFDIRYYDVFLNGRRLSLESVWTITPWEITLTNIHTVYNLTIYERDRDWEYFGLNYKENIYYFSPDDILNDERVSQRNKDKFIKELIDAMKDKNLTIYPNENDEEPQDYEPLPDDVMDVIISYIFYYFELIPKTYVNPDYLQFNENIMEEYYPVVNDEYTLTDNRGTNTLCLDPDVGMASINFDELEEDAEISVYSVGHLEADTDSTLLSESVDNMQSA